MLSGHDAMKSWKQLLALAVVILGYMVSASAQSKDCEGGGGVCKEIGSGKCKKMLIPCKRGLICCEKETPNMLETLRTKRKCQTKRRCSRHQGTCVNPGRGDMCYTFGVDDLCKGDSCTCCLSDKSSCRGTPTCKFQGGICVDSKKSAEFCSSATINKKGCKGKKCVCCIPKEKSCMCGITNKPQPATTTSVPTTTPKTATTTKPPIVPWKPKHYIRSTFPWMPRNDIGMPKNDLRIVGGTEVKPLNKFPWLVGLESTEYPDVGYYCSGAIINSRFVITIAACIQQVVDVKSIKVSIANFNQNSTDDDIPGVTSLVDVKKFFVHEDFSSDTLDNNIALLQLKKPLDLISYDEIKPVCLPVSEDEDYEGDSAVLVGWGVKNDSSIDFSIFSVAYPDTPNEVTLSILGPDCGGTTDVAGKDITSNMLCASSDKGSKKPCLWDAGAPLTVEREGRQVLVGLTAIGECGFLAPGTPTVTPSVYTRITKYIDWIYDIVDGDVKGGVSFCG